MGASATNTYKIETPQEDASHPTRYDFGPDPIHGVIGMHDSVLISTEWFGVFAGLDHSVQLILLWFPVI